MAANRQITCLSATLPGVGEIALANPTLRASICNPLRTEWTRKRANSNHQPFNDPRFRVVDQTGMPYHCSNKELETQVLTAAIEPGRYSRARGYSTCENPVEPLPHREQCDVPELRRNSDAGHQHKAEEFKEGKV
jgi:hypothetical protein